MKYTSIEKKHDITQQLTLEKIGTFWKGAAMLLQHKVYNALSDKQKNFITLKDMKQLEAYVNKGQLVGCFAHHRLIGQLIAASPATDKDLTGGLAGLDINADKAVVIQGVLVDPYVRKMGIMSFMLTQVMNMTAHKQATELWAEIASDNQPSIRGFLSHDFNIVAARVDPTDGCPLYFLKHDTIVNKPKNNQDGFDPVNQNKVFETVSGCLSKDYNTIAKRLNMGDQITTVDWTNKTITWALKTPKL